MIPQAMLARWLHDFIANLAAMIPEPQRPPPPPVPTYGGDFTLNAVRDWGVQLYAGYPAKVQAIYACHAYLSNAPGPLPPPAMP